MVKLERCKVRGNRNEIGIGSLIEQEEGFIAGLKHSMFLNIVLSGEKYPNLEFDQFCKEFRDGEESQNPGK